MKQEIFEYIKNNFPIKANDVYNEFDLWRSMIHRYLKKLVEEWKIYKLWTPPHVFYFPKEQIQEIEHTKETFDFLNVLPNWKFLYWSEWFDKWCIDRGINDIKKEKEIYLQDLSKYSLFKNEFWFIDWILKFKDTFNEVYIDEVYYLDFYSIPKYWKTVLGNLMFYGKQSWDRKIINSILEMIKFPIFSFIKQRDIDSFAFIPPSIDRKIQILTEIKKWLKLDIKELKLGKFFIDNPVPQKSLSKKEDRIKNAQETIFIMDKKFKSDSILLIDDAIWSWSTFNEVAKKIKEKWISKKVIWIAIVWSYKWFDVIKEI